MNLPEPSEASRKALRTANYAGLREALLAYLDEVQRSLSHDMVDAQDAVVLRQLQGASQCLTEMKRRLGEVWTERKT